MDDAEHFSAIEYGPVEAALAEYFDRLDRGASIELTEIIAAHPGCEEGLREFLKQERKLHAVANTSLVAVSHENQAGRTLGDFRLVGELGRGGMGVVYEAEQISLGRRVALKVLPFAPMLDKQQLARFKNEARAAATLDHPNIVAIHSVGSDGGVHYYAMQLIEGQSLAQVIAAMRRTKNPSPPSAEKDLEDGARSTDAAQLTTDFAATNNEQLTTDTQPVAALSTLPEFGAREYYRTVARLGIQAAEALDHAHRNGILHRDIKPGNLMLDADGKLYVTDFGLARIEADAGMTMTGDIIGTLRYMAPEQALAKRVVVDHRSDIYSLGATLYELLTLQPAFGETDRSQLLTQIAFDEPRPPRQIDRCIPVELETIVLKAMRKSPEQRYATAQDLADDLHRFLENKPIRAKPPTWREQAVKWSRRHPAAIWAALLFFLGTTCIFAVSAALVTGSLRREAAQRKLAEAASIEGQVQRDEAERQRAEAEASQYRMSKSLELAQGLLQAETAQVADLELSVGERDPVRLTPSSAPILVWDTNRTGGAAPQCGWTYVWSTETRPEVIGSIFTFYVESEHSSRTHLELVSVATGPVQAKYRGKQIWSPDKAGIQLVLVPNAMAPAQSAAERTAQLEKLARQFEAHIKTDDGFTALMPQLIHRYENVSPPVIDGAIIAFLDYGDPEAVLLLEAQTENGVAKWKYAFAQTGGRGLVGTHLGRRVWRWEPGDNENVLRKNLPDEPYIQTTAMASFRADVIPDVPGQLWATVWNQLHLLKGLLASGETHKVKQLLNDSRALVQEFADTMTAERKQQLARHWSMMLMDLLERSGRSKDFDECFDELGEIGELIDSTFRAKFLNMKAWRFATRESKNVRNGELAVKIATEACELSHYESAQIVDTLAAAYAEVGDFEAAIRWSEKAIELSSESERAELQKRLDAFKAGKPWRE